jgi:hypothetical protein
LGFSQVFGIIPENYYLHRKLLLTGVLGLGALPGLRDHTWKLLSTQEIIIYRGARPWEFSQVLGTIPKCLVNSS